MVADLDEIARGIERHLEIDLLEACAIGGGEVRNRQNRSWNATDVDGDSGQLQRDSRPRSGNNTGNIHAADEEAGEPARRGKAGLERCRIRQTVARELDRVRLSPDLHNADTAGGTRAEGCANQHDIATGRI